MVTRIYTLLSACQQSDFWGEGMAVSNVLTRLTALTTPADKLTADKLTTPADKLGASTNNLLHQTIINHYLSIFNAVSIN